LWAKPRRFMASAARPVALMMISEDMNFRRRLRAAAFEIASVVRVVQAESRWRLICHVGATHWRPERFVCEILPKPDGSSILQIKELLLANM
jgi:hypothetical protein